MDDNVIDLANDLMVAMLDSPLVGDSIRAASAEERSLFQDWLEEAIEEHLGQTGRTLA